MKTIFFISFGISAALGLSLAYRPITANQFGLLLIVTGIPTGAWLGIAAARLLVGEW